MKHNKYIEHLHKYLKPELKKRKFRSLLLHNIELVLCMVMFNTDPVFSASGSIYSSSKKGRPMRDFACMLRSLIMMTFEKVRGITKWVDITRNDKFIHILTGFDPDDKTPGVGTYYDFLKRLIDAPYRKPCDHVVRQSSLLLSSHQRNLKMEKTNCKEDMTPHQPKTEKLVNDLLTLADQPRPVDFNTFLEDLLIQLGVIPNIEAGILSSPFIVAGDGSILQTAASPHGKPTCTCRKQQIYRCSCDRLYTSPTASWCFDSQKNAFIFGDRYYHLVVSQNGHDFPLLTIMPGGNESDYTLSVKALDRLIKALRENHVNAHITAFTGDGHHDSNAHYRYLREKNIAPVIPLSKSAENAKPVWTHLDETPEIILNSDGVPLCPANAVMRHHTYNKRKDVHVYTCPAKRSTHKNGKFQYVKRLDACPRKQDCQPDSSIGPCVYIKSAQNPRLFPPIPRNSNLFKKIMNQRTSAERMNALFDSFNLTRCHRNPMYSLIRLVLASITHHVVVRVRESVDKCPAQILAAQLLHLKELEPKPIDSS